jgi:hypothetical protein
MPTPKRPVGQRPLPSRPGSAPEAEQEEQGVERSQRASSKEDAFNNQAAATGFSVPGGSYVAHLIDAERIVADDSEKESIKIMYEVAEGEYQGKEVPAWYNLFDTKGVAQKGGEYFKRDVVLLGVRQEGNEPTYSELDDVCQALKDERPLCNITCKHNPPYFNIYLQGLSEG